MKHPFFLQKGDCNILFRFDTDPYCDSPNAQHCLHLIDLLLLLLQSFLKIFPLSGQCFFLLLHCPDRDRGNVHDAQSFPASVSGQAARISYPLPVYNENHSSIESSLWNNQCRGERVVVGARSVYKKNLNRSMDSRVQRRFQFFYWKLRSMNRLRYIIIFKASDRLRPGAYFTVLR